MIIEYHRPSELSEAILLLSREYPKTVPLGGGNGLSQGSKEELAVVDLQALKLNVLEKTGGLISIGAAAKLQSLTDWEVLPLVLRQSITRETPLNQRNTATLGGSLIRADDRYSLPTILLALDCQLFWEPGNIKIFMGDWLACRRNYPALHLMVSAQFIEPESIKYEFVTKTPCSYPIVSACLARWTSGRNRLVLGGVGTTPICVFDGNGFEGVIDSIINARSQIPNKYSSYKYQQEVSQTLINRLIEQE